MHNAGFEDWCKMYIGVGPFEVLIWSQHLLRCLTTSFKRVCAIADKTVIGRMDLVISDYVVESKVNSYGALTTQHVD